jgi:hypothetical protein
MDENFEKCQELPLSTITTIKTPVITNNWANSIYGKPAQ